MPGMPRVGNGSSSSSSGLVRGGGGKTRSSWSALYAIRTATPRAAASRRASATTSPGSPGSRTS
jgi:hypothetical protein